MGFSGFWIVTPSQQGLALRNNQRLADRRIKHSLSSCQIGALAQRTDIKSPQEIPEAEKKRLHIDDNTSVLLQYNSEKEMIDLWRTRFIALSRARGDVMFHSLVGGVYSEAFYKQFESLCDGIIDFRSHEQGGQIEHEVRVRAMRGRTFDSRWRRLRLLTDGEVALAL